jgi:hypothetical protein
VSGLQWGSVGQYGCKSGVSAINPAPWPEQTEAITAGSLAMIQGGTVATRRIEAAAITGGLALR